MSQQVSALPLVLIFPILGVVILVASWLISRRRAAARREALARQAMMMGYSFSPGLLKPNQTGKSGLEPEFAESLKAMQIFQKGRRQRISNVMSKDSNRREWIFDFQYETGGGNNRHRVHQTVFGCRQRNWSIPGFTLHKEGFFSRIFDGADIDFEQDDEFSHQYLLKGKDETAIRRLFTPSIRSFLTERRDWVVEANGPWIFVCRKGRIVKPDDLMTALGEFNRFLSLLSNELER
jgi:hypothetical protein